MKLSHADTFTIIIYMYTSFFPRRIVSLTAVFSVVMQCSSPQEHCVMTMKMSVRETTHKMNNPFFFTMHQVVSNFSTSYMQGNLKIMIAINIID